jgi:hypothetical protein
LQAQNNDFNGGIAAAMAFTVNFHVDVIVTASQMSKSVDCVAIPNRKT